jgi:replication-associated recombination protein RarA
MKDLGYGAEYKYPPNYRNGRVRQEYLPRELRGRRFVEDRDLGTEVDPELQEEEGDQEMAEDVAEGEAMEEEENVGETRVEEEEEEEEEAAVDSNEIPRPEGDMLGADEESL